MKVEIKRNWYGGRTIYISDTENISPAQEKLLNNFRKFSKIENIIRKTILTVSLPILLFGTFYESYVQINKYTIRKSPEILNESQLELCLKKEKKLQGVLDKNIYICFKDDIETSYCHKNKDGSYDIGIAPNQHKTNVVKHEVRHIADSYFNENISLEKRTRKNVITSVLKNVFYEEPKTSLYTFRHMEKK
jgi:hypothetical protein